MVYAAEVHTSRLFIDCAHFLVRRVAHMFKYHHHRTSRGPYRCKANMCHDVTMFLFGI